MYCICAEICGDDMYLAWQKPCFLEDDGYFWTWKEWLDKCIQDNVPEHPFLFESEAEANEFVKTFKCHARCFVTEYLI